MPRPLPPAPHDGGDALLTTRELATAFNLDRRRGPMAALGRVPWGRILLTLAVIAMAIFAIWLAYQVFSEPVNEMLGTGQSERNGASPSEGAPAP